MSTEDRANTAAAPPGSRLAPLTLAASILNADFGHLADQIRAAEVAGVDWIHVDVMDGHFVPNLTLGWPVIEAFRRSTSLPLDVHLMIEHPERYVEQFAAAGASYLTVHTEAVTHLHRLLLEIRERGMQAGAALCPATPLTAIEEVCDELDLLLIMTIDPGFGGQTLIPGTVDKVVRARQLLDRRGSRAALQVDGGVKSHNVAQLARAGATCFVVGTGIFQAPGGIASGVAEVRAALNDVCPDPP